MNKSAASTDVLDPVRYAATVPLPADQAFRLFTEGYNTWWPGHHIGTAEMAEAVLEPRTGGRYYERGVDGSECEWGRVLACEPRRRRAGLGPGPGPYGNDGALMLLGQQRCSIVAASAAGEERMQVPGAGRGGLMGHVGRQWRARAEAPQARLGRSADWPGTKWGESLDSDQNWPRS